MNTLKQYFIEFVAILNEMSPYLMLGFLFAGILYVYFPKHKVKKYLGGNTFSSVLYAAILGIPLPLCSCGVIPTGISFHKNGASKGSAVSFLISTPQTGIDSIMVTYSMLGLPFALIRPVVAFFTGIIGGLFTNILEKNGKKSIEISKDIIIEDETEKKKPAIIRLLKYAYVDFLSDIAKWLVIGIVIAAGISILVPDNFFLNGISNRYLNMLIILGVSIPLYVCATASVPIAAALMMKGLSPGAALVFLMAGPATNAATITVIGKALGRKTLGIYLATIILGSFLFGILIDNLLPANWFGIPLVHAMHEHHHEFMPIWIKYASSGILASLILFAFIKRYYRKKNGNNKNILKDTMETMTIKVEGMTCNHCKNTVETHVKNLNGISFAEVNLATKELTVNGENINTAAIKEVVEKLGYRYLG